MKYAEINKQFTNKVSEYIAKGYTINTASMSGSQGEVAKVDLTNGKEIIRIRLASFSNWQENVEGYEIVIGRNTDDVKPHSNSTWGTIWDSHLEVIESIRFYKLGNYDADWFGTLEEAKVISEKRLARYYAKKTSGNEEVITDKAMEIAKRIIRREFGYKRINEDNVKVIHRDGKYIVFYNGKCYKLH